MGVSTHLQNPPHQPKLLDQARAYLRTRHYARSTEKGMKGMMSPVDFPGEAGFMAPNIPLSKLPAELTERLCGIVYNGFQGDVVAALAALETSHQTQGR